MIPVEPSPWASEIPPAEEVAAPSQHPRCPPGFSLLMSLRVPGKQCLKRGAWMDPVWGGEPATLASRLPHRPTAPWAVSAFSIAGHPGLFSEGRLLSPPAWRRDTAPSLLINETQCNELFKGKLIRLLMGFLIWEEEKG